MYKAILKVEGMKCGMCECHINDLIRKNVKVKKVKSSYKKSICVFTYYEKININEIIKIIQEDGYKVDDYQSNISEG